MNLCNTFYPWFGTNGFLETADIVISTPLRLVSALKEQNLELDKYAISLSPHPVESKTYTSDLQRTTYDLR